MELDLRCRFTFIIFSFLTAVLSASCERCAGGDPGLVAELVAVSGRVERDRATQMDQWKPAELRSRFYGGDGVRTLTAAGAILDVTGGAELHFKRIPTELECQVCGKRYEPGEDLACPACQSIQVRVVAGEEFHIESIGIEA